MPYPLSVGEKAEAFVVSKFSFSKDYFAVEMIRLTLNEFIINYAISRRRKINPWSNQTDQ